VSFIHLPLRPSPLPEKFGHLSPQTRKLPRTNEKCLGTRNILDVRTVFVLSITAHERGTGLARESPRLWLLERYAHESWATSHPLAAESQIHHAPIHCLISLETKRTIQKGLFYKETWRLTSAWAHVCMFCMCMRCTCARQKTRMCLEWQVQGGARALAVLGGVV